MLVDRRHQSLRVADDLRRGDPDRRADEVTDPDFLEGHIEGHGEALIDDVVAADAEHVVFATKEVADAPLADGDALGRARRTGGIDDIGRVVRLGGAQVAGRVYLGEQVFDGPGFESERLEGGQAGTRRQDPFGGGGTQADRDAVDRGVGVEGEPGGTIERDAYLCFQQVDAAGEPEADDVAGAVVEPGKRSGEAFGFVDQVCVADRGRTEAQGELGRVFPGGLTQDVRQRFFAEQFGAGGAAKDHRMASWRFNPGTEP